MSEFLAVAKVSDVKTGMMKKIIVERHAFLHARIKDMYHCTDVHGPHLGGDLSQGTLNGYVLICSRYHSQFDISNGTVIQWTDLSGTILSAAKNQRPPRSLRIYRIKVEGDTILIKR